MTITAAGVLPKSHYQGTEYYYFGVTKQNELTTFCGRRDNNEKIKKCAAREFIEESLGAIVKKDKIKEQLKSMKKVVKITNSRHKQEVYIADVKIKSNPMKKFDKKCKEPGLKHHQKEIKKIVAISSATLRRLVQTNTRDYAGSNFRADAWQVISQAHQQRVF